MIKDYKQIIVEFQRDLRGEFDENSERISRVFQKNSRRELQENSRNNSMGITGGFLEKSVRIPGHTLYNFSTCLVPLTTRSTR